MNHFKDLAIGKIIAGKGHPSKNCNYVAMYVLAKKFKGKNFIELQIHKKLY